MHKNLDIITSAVALIIREVIIAGRFSPPRMSPVHHQGCVHILTEPLGSDLWISPLGKIDMVFPVAKPMGETVLD